MIRAFLDSLHELCDSYHEVYFEVREEMEEFFCSQRKFTSFLEMLDRNYHSGIERNKLKREYFEENLIKFDGFLNNVSYFFMSVNQLIFKVLDFLDYPGNKSKISSRYLNISEKLYKLHGKGFLFKSLGEDFSLIECIKNSRNYVVVLFDDKFLETKMLPKEIFTKFRDGYFNFIKYINIYFECFRTGNVQYISCSLRSVNFYMMSMARLINRLCLAMWLMWLYR
ncbi:hypothetical protein AL01_09370 [Bombella intestini]|uniref:Uncharacterized protein n=1 Tax=Bombella intestini TaxID=1539051 RepID=A0A1S8GN12_9PROT|nr:hypothetical protein [Bombella intestini]OOL17010.1 hypothetical protein AL01_09370 [Bombella intestini]